MDLIIFLIIGALAGYLGSRLIGGAGNGLIMNMVIGILGSFLGGKLLGGFLDGIPYGLGGFITAVLGSALLIWVISLIKK
ncbi:MAG: GlsB/YeaQ/YmgE family stress response membrane protein [Paludibacteraceae bacterium]|nr:GlsB/YeaQ/YmgE family stress response membrane protein [Paludibacteraceae bacterium]